MKVYSQFELKKYGYTVKNSPISAIHDFFNLSTEESAIGYRKKVNLNYGYTYILLCGGEDENEVFGTYISNDRFYQQDGAYFKEMIIYEFSIYDEGTEDEIQRKAEVLYEYLLLHADKTGCNRILFEDGRTNQGFENFMADKGFLSMDNRRTLSLGEVEMCDSDKIIIPTDKDALSFRTLFHLRESFYKMTEEKCELDLRKVKINVNRHSALVTFSSEITTELGNDFYLDGERELSILDALRQAVERVEVKSAVIYDERPDNDTFPDIIINGQWGIFIDKVSDKNYAERQLWINQLRAEGKITHYSIHTLKIDEEIGGCEVFIFPISLNSGLFS